jgi:hypothetical protein
MRMKLLGKFPQLGRKVRENFPQRGFKNSLIAHPAAFSRLSAHKRKVRLLLYRWKSAWSLAFRLQEFSRLKAGLQALFRREEL